MGTEYSGDYFDPVLNEWLKRRLIDLIYVRSARSDYQIGLQAKFLSGIDGCASGDVCFPMSSCDWLLKLRVDPSKV